MTDNLPTDDFLTPSAIHAASSLKGQRALITGGTGALGIAMASVLRVRGARVAVTGRRRQRLHQVTDHLNALNPDAEPCVAITADLSLQTDRDTLIAQALEELGGLDILVNNAGATADTLALRMKTPDFERVLDLNLTTAFVLGREALKTMTRKRSGRIVNISSIVGFTGNAGQANYSAAKAGLIGLTKSLAQEVASRSVTINAVAPGPIGSAMTDALDEKVRQTILDRVPLRRWGQAHEIAHAVAFLCSPAAGFITGQTLHINGGMAMI